LEEEENWSGKLKKKERSQSKNLGLWKKSILLKILIG